MVGGMLCKSDKPSIIIIIIMYGLTRFYHLLVLHWCVVLLVGLLASLALLVCFFVAEFCHALTQALTWALMVQ